MRVRRENSRRGNSVARITGAGITDAGFALGNKQREGKVIFVK